MFNYAKHQVPHDLQREKALHMQRMVGGREQALQDDGKHLAILMSQQGQHDPSELMDNVRYWQFVKEFDGKYYEEAKRLAIELVPQVKKNLPLVPPPQQPQGGAAGAPAPGGPPGAPPAGAPPPMASSVAIVKTGAMYLIRDDGKPHKLMGSFVGDIITGKQQYLDENGIPFCLKIKRNGDLSVNMGSPSAIEANRMQSELPDEIIGTISSFMKKPHAVPPEDPSGIASGTFLRYRRTKSFDLLPVSLVFLKDSQAVLMLSMVHGVKEPPETQELRKLIGNVMIPYMTRLKRALVIDGFDFVEVRSPLPPFATHSGEEQRKHADRPPPVSTMRVLDDEDIGSSTDFRSLLMTAINKKSEDAARRLAIIMARYPELAKRCGMCSEDLSGLILTCGEYGKVANLVRGLVDGDDALIMESYVDAGDFAKLCISHLVASQDRRDIIGAVPEMCVTDGVLNIEFFSKLDASDEKAKAIIIEVCNSKITCPPKTLDRKLMEAASAGSMAALDICKSRKCPYAIVKIMEDGGDIDNTIDFPIPDTDIGAILAVALGNSGVQNGFPKRISELFGKKTALQYMKSTRTNWDGEDIPAPSNIFSFPDNPLPLAKDLADIEDVAGMLVLLHKCASNGGNGKETMGAIRTLVRKLSRLDYSKQAHAILSGAGITMTQDDNNHDVITLLKAGDDVGAAMALRDMYENDNASTYSILEHIPEPSNPKLFIDMLPSELAARISMRWPTNVVSHIINLPYGKTAIGINGMYKIIGCKAFASSKDGAFKAGSTIVAQGLGMLPTEPN